MEHGKHQDEPAAVLLGVFSTQEAADEAGAADSGEADEGFRGCLDIDSGLRE